MKTVDINGNITERVVSTADSAARFVVPVELCELDAFAAPDRAWTATTVSLNRTQLVVSSRRMTFIGRDILATIKLASGSLAKLQGTVTSCEYHGRSMHRIVIALTTPGTANSSVDPDIKPLAN